MHSSTLTSKGQITVPADTSCIQSSNTQEFKTRRAKSILAKKEDDITKAFGMFRVDKKISLSDIQKATAPLISGFIA